MSHQLTPDEVRAANARAQQPMIDFFKAEIPKLLARNLAESRMLQEMGLSYFLEEHSMEPGKWTNGGFMRRIGGLYTQGERDFLQDACEKFERVKTGFAYFSLFSANQRPLEAIRISEYVLRTGWQRVGVPLGFNQTVSDHHRSGKVLATLIFPDDPAVAKYFPFHDTSESVSGDFTPFCLPKADKMRIENLSVRLLTASALQKDNIFAQWIAATYEIYENDSSRHAGLKKRMKDCDLLEMPVEAIVVMNNCPPSEKKGVIERLQEFWDYTAQRLTSARAKDFYDSLSKERHGLTRDFRQIMTEATEYVYSRAENGNALRAALAQTIREENKQTREARPSRGPV